MIEDNSEPGAIGWVDQTDPALVAEYASVLGLDMTKWRAELAPTGVLQFQRPLPNETAMGINVWIDGPKKGRVKTILWAYTGAPGWRDFWLRLRAAVGE